MQLPSGQRLWVKGDLSRLTQALSNVIVNAAKFSAEAGAIVLHVQALDDQVEISVTDRGQGMAPDFLPHAFELFAQEDQGGSQRPPGLGIGLTLARRIVQLHNGRIDAFSDGTGKGARIVLALPRIDPGRSVDNVPAMALGERYRVLIVEDNAVTGGALRQQMEMWGNEVRLAADADAAIAEAQAFRPHIVLCSLGVPGLDRLDRTTLRARSPVGAHLPGRVTSVGGIEDEPALWPRVRFVLGPTARGRKPRQAVALLREPAVRGSVTFVERGRDGRGVVLARVFLQRL